MVKFYVKLDDDGTWLLGVFIDHPTHGQFDRVIKSFAGWSEAMRMLNDLTEPREW